MRKNALMLASVLMTLTLGSSAALAAPVPEAEMRTARVEANTLSSPVDATVPSKPAVAISELRDCAALVLVGGMLLGLAAAVRRTA